MRAQGAQRARARGKVGTRIAIPGGAGDPGTRRTGGGGARAGGGAGAGPERFARRADKEPAPRAPRPGLASLPRGGPGFVSALCSGLRPPCSRQVSEPRGRAGAPASPFPSTPPPLQPQFPEPPCPAPGSPPADSYLRTSWSPARLCPPAASAYSARVIMIAMKEKNKTPKDSMTLLPCFYFVEVSGGAGREGFMAWSFRDNPLHAAGTGACTAEPGHLELGWG